MNYFYLVIMFFFILLCVNLYIQLNTNSKSEITPGGDFSTIVLVPNPYAFITWQQGSQPSIESIWSSAPKFKTTNEKIINPTFRDDNSIVFFPSSSTITNTTIKLVSMRYYFSRTDIDITVKFEINELKPLNADNPVKSYITVAENIKSSSRNDLNRATSFSAFPQPTFTINSDQTLSLILSGASCGENCVAKDSFIVLKVEVSSVTTDRPTDV